MSCWVQVLILFWASMCDMSSVLSPLMAKMVSPGHRSPWAALLPGVTYRNHSHTHAQQSKHTQEKEKERAVISGVKLSGRKKNKKRVLAWECQHRGQIQHKAALFWFMWYCLGQHSRFTFSKASSERHSEVWSHSEFEGGEMSGKNWNFFYTPDLWNSVKNYLRSLSNCISLNLWWIFK